MIERKRFAPEITIGASYLLKLKALEFASYRWGLAAAGMMPSYNHPVGKLMARDMMRETLDRYFEAIEKFIPKKREGEIA
jgi:hypothetical protein